MAQKSLFQRLSRLFSTDVVIRNVGGTKLKIADVNKIQTTGKYQTNSLIDRFSRLYIYNNKNIFNPNLNYQTLRIQLYSDYEAMESDPIIASSLDILADEATLKNDQNEILSIRSSDENIQKVLYNLFYDVLNIEFNLWSWIRNMCLHPDTPIALLDGTESTVKEITDRMIANPDEEIWVYSIQDGTNKIVPGYVKWSGKTRENAQLVRVTLDNKKFVDVTPDHRFLLRTGTYKEAQYLEKGDSLMPFYTDETKKSRDCIEGYERVYNPQSGRYNVTHRVVARECGISDIEKEKLNKQTYHTHHIDFNKKNNSPKNLERLTEKDHLQLHKKHAKELLWSDPEIITKRKNSLNKWLTSSKHSEQVSARQKGIYPSWFEKYNNSDLHSKHNALRSETMERSWRNGSISIVSLRYDESCINYISSLILKQNKWIGMTDLANILKKDSIFLSYLKKANPNYKKKFTSSFYASRVGALIEKATGKKYHLFVAELVPFVVDTTRYKQIASRYSDVEYINHKVDSVEWLKDTSDTYCIEVVGPNGEEDRHNFAVCPTDSQGVYSRDGIFVANCKYGDFFLKLEISDEFGVYNVFPYTVYHMVRREGEDPANPSKVTFQIDPDGLASSNDPNYIPKSNSRVISLENYEVAHFRLISDTNYLPYGRSYLEPARKVFKQLTLMEDAMLIHRIMRAPEKRMFFINVGNIPPAEVDQFIQKSINQIKKTPYMDPESGQYNLRFNLQNMLEDYYIPVRGNDTATRIDTTKGLDYDGITDVEYLRDKMFAALKIPKAYFGYEGDLQGKATLAAEDIRFARTVERIQKIIESELSKIALVHLYSQGFTGESLTNFEIQLTTPSIIFEQEKVALLQEKVELATRMLDSKLFSTDYVYDHLFNFSEDEYQEMRDLVREDGKRIFRNSQIENEGNDPVQSGISYGTPHDLASLYGRRAPNAPKVPTGYDEDEMEPGRPKEVSSIIKTTDDPLGGRDRLGTHGMKGGYPSDNDNVNEIDNFTAKKVYYQNKDIFDRKKLVFENDTKEEKEDNLLNEDNIKDLSN